MCVCVQVCDGFGHGRIGNIFTGQIFSLYTVRYVGKVGVPGGVARAGKKPR